MDRATRAVGPLSASSSRLGELGSFAKLSKPRLEALRIGALICATWLENRRAMEALQPTAQHRSIDLVQEAACNMNDASRIDPEQIPVLGEVVDRAKRDPVHDGGATTRVSVLNDVGGL